MDEELAHLGAVRLVGRGVVVELHGADDPVAEARHQQQARAAPNRRHHRLAPERLEGRFRARQDEADAGAGLDAVPQKRREFADPPGGVLGRERRDFDTLDHVDLPHTMKST